MFFLILWTIIWNIVGQHLKLFRRLLVELWVKMCKQLVKNFWKFSMKDYLKDSYCSKNAPITMIFSWPWKFETIYLFTGSFSSKKQFFPKLKGKVYQTWGVTRTSALWSTFHCFYHISVLKMHNRHLESKQMDQIPRSDKQWIPIFRCRVAN